MEITKREIKALKKKGVLTDNMIKAINEGKKKRNHFKVGDKVKYKDEINNKLIPNNKKVFVVYAIYSNTKLSLGLRDYPEIEQDNQTDIREIVKIK